MSKKTFSEINVKAATATGAIFGFICWLLVIPYGYSGYMMDIFHSYSPLSILIDIVLGAIAGAFIGIVYNWMLKLDK